jgi:hypothetical protein
LSAIAEAPRTMPLPFPGFSAPTQLISKASVGTRIVQAA